jgi:branched-chain amino acid transport system substrate-binding protein
MKQLNRRDLLLAGAGAAALPLSGTFSPAFAADKLTIGFISPITGPLGGFGQTDGYVLSVVRKALEKGLTIGGKTYEVEILDRDTQSDPSRAGQLAKDLITNSGIDLMLAVSTPETINPVADACEAAGVPCLSTVMPWEAWYFGRGAKPGEPSPFKWTYHFGFGVEEFYKAYIKQWSLIETNKKVGVMYPNDADGNAIRAVLAPKLAAAGYTIVDPGAYENGTADFSSQIALFKSEGVEIFNGFPIPPDFVAFWRQAAQQGLTKQIKIAQPAKFGIFPSNMEALGSLATNMSTAAYWHKAFPYKSSLAGISATELADGYEAESGKQWTVQLGASLAVFDAATEALKASTDPKNKAEVAKSISTLKTSTIAGAVDFTSGPVPNVASGPIVGMQWVKSADGKHAYDLVVTENSTDARVPVTATLLPYNG